MAVAQAYGKTVTSGSVFAYDVADTRNSYIGEPTTNIYSTDGFSFWQLDGNHTATRYTGNAPDLTVITNNYDYHTIVATGNWSNEVNRALLWTDSGLLQLNTEYAVSFYARVTSTSTANIGAAFYGNALPNSFTLTNEWQRFTLLTSTTATYRPFEFGSKSGAITFQVAGIQYEAKSHSTPYVNGTRSVTQGLLPLVGTSTIDLSNVSFDSNAQMTFDGTDDRIEFPAITLSGDFTISQVVTLQGTANGPMPIGGGFYGNGSTYLGYIWFRNTANEIRLAVNGELTVIFSVDPTLWVNKTILYTIKRSGSTATLYINGAEIASGTVSTNNFDIRTVGYSYSTSYASLGTIPVTRIYNRALTAAEVKQNFDFYDARFGIDVDTYYFAVSNRFTNLSQRYLDGSGNTVRIKARNMASTTPAYILYQKPSATNTGPGDYTEVARDNIGTPARITFKGAQTSYSGGRYFTTVTVRRSKKNGRLFFDFPNGKTSQYGEGFYKTIITPHVP
jgi:hypothetical protein